MFLWSAPEPTIEQKWRRRWFKNPSHLLWRHCHGMMSTWIHSSMTKPHFGNLFINYVIKYVVLGRMDKSHKFQKCISPISHHTAHWNRNGHISVPTWRTVGYGTGALWDLWDWYITMLGLVQNGKKIYPRLLKVMSVRPISQGVNNFHRGYQKNAFSVREVLVAQQV